MMTCMLIRCSPGLRGYGGGFKTTTSHALVAHALRLMGLGPVVIAGGPISDKVGAAGSWESPLARCVFVV